VVENGGIEFVYFQLILQKNGLWVVPLTRSLHMTKDETLAVTSQFHDLIYTIVREAWDEWLAVKAFRAKENFGR